MRRVYIGSIQNRSTNVQKMSRGEQIAAIVGSIILVTYTCFAFVTGELDSRKEITCGLLFRSLTAHASIHVFLLHIAARHSNSTKSSLQTR